MMVESQARSRVRVAVVMPSLRGGGLERVVHDLVLALLDRGHRPGVFTVGGTGHYARGLVHAGVPVRDCSEGALRIRGFPCRLLSAVSSFRPDLIHAHSGTWYPASVVKSLLRYPKLIYTEHGRYPPEPRRRALVERWCHRRTDRFVTVSAELSRYMAAFLDLEEPPVVIPNGIDLAAFEGNGSDPRDRLRQEWGVSEDEVLLMSVGRLAAVKNHAGLLEAFARIAPSTAGLRLAIVGAGRLERELRAFAVEAGIDRQVTFAGFRADAADCLRAADCFVSASHSEGLPISLLEALAAGLPVVAYGVGGIPEALGQPAAGLLVAPGDKDGFASALSRLAGDPELRSTLAARAKLRARDFSLDSLVESYERLYSGLTAEVTR